MDAEPAPQEPTYGLRSFVDRNANLLRLLSLLLAAAAILRSVPEDDAVAVLLFLTVLMVFLVFWRLWRDLAPVFGVLPGNHWTTELILFYYCSTVALIVAVLYLVEGYLDRRHQYLSAAMGTALALAAATWLSRWAIAGHRLLVWAGRLCGGSHVRRERLAALIAAALLVVLTFGSYTVAYRVGPALNGWLDSLFSPAQPPRGALRASAGYPGSRRRQATTSSSAPVTIPYAPISPTSIPANTSVHSSSASANASDRTPDNPCSQVSSTHREPTRGGSRACWRMAPSKSAAPVTSAHTPISITSALTVAWGQASIASPRRALSAPRPSASHHQRRVRRPASAPMAMIRPLRTA